MQENIAMFDPQNILIVDDKPENLFALENILSVLDAEVVKAANANDALIASLNHDFALAILDVHMPEMDGYELAELLRSRKQTRNLPIIFLSAVFYDDEHVVMGYQAGAVDFITKPFHPGILLGKASAFLELSRQRQAGNRLASFLQNSNQELEVRVRERTESLEKANTALRESEKELRRLSGRLLSAQEEERKRIAAELHDSVGSSLGAVKFSLESTLCDEGMTLATRQSMEAAVQMVIHTIEEVRRIMSNLRPPLLDRVGLISALERLERQYASVYESIAIRMGIEVKEEDIPEHLKIVIFRVAQEAFHNMAKYSKATCAGLELCSRDGRIVLHIEDNGVGFDLRNPGEGDNSAEGLGLSTMRERVNLSGGRFGIESCAGKGTRIEAVWPVQNQNPAITSP
jgi:signal transduction histidine kinase